MQPGAVLRDRVVNGLHVRCFRDRKSFYLYFRTKTGRERRPKLGDVGALTLDQARRAARELLAAVALGRDPIEERRKARWTGASVAALADNYIAEYLPTKKARSQIEDKRLIAAHIKPRLGGRRVVDVEREDITALHESMRGTPYQANRVLALLKTMFTLAEKWRMRPPHSNPCRHVTQFRERPRKRYMRQDEAPRIAAVLASYEDRRPEAVAFIYLLILSGARPDEIARARPEWVEPRPLGGVLRLPDSKIGARLVYLPPQIMVLLDRLPKGETLTGIKSPKSLWNIVREKAGCPDLRLYDTRHSFASAALQAGYTLDQIGELLGHASTQTTHRYAHLIDQHAQRAAADTANLLEGMMRQPTAQAVPRQ
jgi:integrase